MAKKNIRVKLPTGSPDSMIGLSEAITEQHESYSSPEPSPAPSATAEPAEESPLHHLDMDGFKKTTTRAKEMLKESRKLHSHAEGLTMQAYTIMGFAHGQTIQTPGTLYFDMDVIRGVLLSHHKEDEEAIEDYGFNVLVGETNGRTDIGIEIPANRFNDFLTLCDSVVEQHESLGEASPLHHLDMKAFKEKTTKAKSILKEARKHHKKAQKFHMRSLVLIGTDKGQTSRTKGTLYYTLDVIRTILLKKFKGTEEDLEEWGFVVVISETTAGKKTKTVSLIIPAGQQTVQTKVISGSQAENIGFTVLEWWEGSMPSTTTTQFAPDQFSTINAPSGIITIRNLSLEDTGRCKVKVKI